MSRGGTLSLIVFCLGYYLLAGLAINIGYHRLLSHRSLRLPRGLERILVTLGLPAGTPIQWAGNHRRHHAYTDRVGDPHSPVVDGFWHAHVGWYIGTKHPLLCLLYSVAGPLRILYDGWIRPRTNQQFNHLAPDVGADPYYRWVSRPAPYALFAIFHVGVPVGYAFLKWGGCGIAALWITLIWIFNVGDAIDSVAHLFGDRPFAVQNQARNNFILAILALGDGWHANHHVFPNSARHGLLPGQIDWSWGVIALLGWLGLATEIRVPTREEIDRRLLKTMPYNVAQG